MLVFQWTHPTSSAYDRSITIFSLQFVTLQDCHQQLLTAHYYFFYLRPIFLQTSIIKILNISVIWLFTFPWFAPIHLYRFDITIKYMGFNVYLGPKKIPFAFLVRALSSWSAARYRYNIPQLCTFSISAAPSIATTLPSYLHFQ
jgi:hypothetical protein